MRMATMLPDQTALASSFRDPSGFVYRENGTLLRQVNRSYAEHYDHLMASGLYKELVGKNLLIPHEEIDAPEAYKTLKPTQIPFITYPSEWSFSQLKDSALVTLAIQRRALAHGMTLKDASAYNIALVEGRPKLIDTLSFEKIEEGAPWVAYRQFCQHFLAPLALMHYRDVRLQQLFVTNIDGVPLDLASTLLPARSRLNLAMQLHIHIHARAQKRYADKDTRQITQKRSVSKQALLGVIDNLESAIKKFSWNPKQTAWADYYQDDSYTASAFADKQALIGGMIEQINPRVLWDCGANTGEFSRLASQKGIVTVSMDSDPGAVELNYQQMRQRGDKTLFPLVIDLTNPTPAIGWANRERDSLMERGPADLVLALALIHHLAISNNVPLGSVTDFFARISQSLIIEFVPKSDHKVQDLLLNRQDIFPDYTQEGFEAAFQQRFTIEQRVPVKDSQRVIYLMRNKAQ